jgi:dolichol-phosphate mannosyltransferase
MRSAMFPSTDPGPRLGVVCPMANEADNAERFVRQVLAECRALGFVSVVFYAVLDTVSSDDTRQLLDTLSEHELRLRVVWAPETRGVADAYIRGYREAIADGCDWILEIDAGYSHDPTDIGKLVVAMAAGRDCVFGTRFAPGGSNLGPRRRRAISRVGTLLANALLGTRLTDMTGGFELFTREALELVLDRGIRSKGPFFQTEIRTYCRRLRVAEVPIHYDSASHRIDLSAIREACANLLHLFRLRLVGDL